MKRRIISILICMMMLVAFVSGCAAPEVSPSPEPTETAKQQEPVSTPTPTPTPTPEEPAFSLYDIPAEFEDPFAPERTEMDFSELAGMRYEGIEEFKKAAERMEQACEEEGALDELKELYKFMYEENIKAGTASAVAQIEYDMDSRNEELAEESLNAQNIRQEMSILYSNAVNKALDSDYGEELTTFIGEDVAELFSEKPIDPEREAELLNRESQLIMDYEQMMQKAYTVEIDGEEWDEQKVLAERESLSSEEYYELINAIYEKKNEAVVPIYMELVELRKEIAALSGFEDPAAYYYEEIYGRDYSPEEAQSFHASVKECIVPADQKLTELKANKTDAVVETEDILPIMEEILPLISGEMAEIFAYMTEHEMVYLADDFTVSSNRGYTIALDQAGQPYVYNSVYGDAQGLSDTFHEFGHYCDYYLNGLYGAKMPEINIDLAEVPSTALEMLIYDYYDEMLEGDVNDEKLYRLYASLVNIVDGCMYDEAQQRVFAYEGELTADAVNGIFREVAAEYGRNSNIDEGHFWVLVSHTFRSPFYNLSYATAASAAMEIWLIAQEEGQEAAIDLYLNILSHGCFEYSYAEALEICGMRGFTSEEFMKELADAVLEETEKLLGPQTENAA